MRQGLDSSETLLNVVLLLDSLSLDTMRKQILASLDTRQLIDLTSAERSAKLGKLRPDTLTNIIVQVGGLAGRQHTSGEPLGN